MISYTNEFISWCIEWEYEKKVNCITTAISTNSNGIQSALINISPCHNFIVVTLTVVKHSEEKEEVNFLHKFPIYLFNFPAVRHVSQYTKNNHDFCFHFSSRSSFSLHMLYTLIIKIIFELNLFVLKKKCVKRSER